MSPICATRRLLARMTASLLLVMPQSSTSFLFRENGKNFILSSCSTTVPTTFRHVASISSSYASPTFQTKQKGWNHHQHHHCCFPEMSSKRRDTITRRAMTTNNSNENNIAKDSHSNNDNDDNDNYNDVDTYSFPTIPECEELLSVAELGAKAAGEIIIQHLGLQENDVEDENTDAMIVSSTVTTTTTTTSSSSSSSIDVKMNIKDIVTKYDTMAQERIVKIVSDAYPTHSFLGEEDVAAGGEASAKALEEKLLQSSTSSSSSSSSSSSPYLWICDPIDGTANFASGMPLCGVTMAVLYKGTPVVSCIYDPHRDELFSTIQGQGAWLKTTCTRTGKVLQTSLGQSSMMISTPGLKLSDTILNAGCPADPNAFSASLRGMAAINGKARGIRVLASSCITLAWVAAGRISGHFGYDLSSWDLVAGAMLIQEAGGHVTDLNGSPYQVETRNMLCTSPSVEKNVHNEILSILEDADATTFVRQESE